MVKVSLRELILLSIISAAAGNSLLQIKTLSSKALPDEELQKVPQWAAALFTLAIFLGICVAYRGHGVIGLQVISTQVAAIIITQLSTKALMNDGFNYPMTIASIHFLCIFIAMVAWRASHAIRGIKDRLTVMVEDSSDCLHSVIWYFRRLAPIAMLQCMNVSLNTWSLLYVDAGFNALIGILAPVVTALVAAVLGARISGMGWIGIAIAIAGDALVSIEGSKIAMNRGGAFTLVLFGIGLGISAMLARSVRSVLIDCQMNEYAKDTHCPKLSPIEVAALLSPLVLFASMLTTLAIEGFHGYKALLVLGPYALRMLALSTACALYLTIMGLVLIKMLGASAAQIAGKMNILVTAALSSAFLGEAISVLEIIGALAVLCGAAIFENSGSVHNQTAKLKKDDENPSLLAPQ